jgi:pyruvate carboxylase subunit B
MVGKIVSVSVKVGDQVKEDDQVAVLEAMKM